ncbi:MAG: septum formation protein Maf [Bacteroidetes bacterium]|nr:MAG: septum formation protein Maf [Bacteroidota bacterium]REK08053.1 MAG: septum formation protein Maf [Bacteroidota bacterium]REK32258.1 MAG: septum formation protein Maf [Bacteroidota bacterium]REK47410.1 MAG: septum formation protein Maf [Bacteroidota bacterium]
MKELKNYSLVLGSASPRRKQLLEAINLDIRIVVVPIEEKWPDSLKEGEIAEYLAREKAKAIRPFISNREVLITADTIVCILGQVLNKPEGLEESRKMLRILSGKTHQVFTGVCITSYSGMKCFSVKSDVKFQNLNEDAIEKYISDFKPMDKAGSYGAQETLPDNYNPCSDAELQFMAESGNENLFEAIQYSGKVKRIPLIEKIEGSFFNVVGLPLAELYNELKSF